MVKEFHLKHNIYTKGLPGIPSIEEVCFRIRLISEEYGELMEGIDTDDVLLIADALGDLVYVCYGMALAYGIPLDDIVKEIHKSNMTKDIGEKKNKKVMKGKSFIPPDINGILFGKRHSENK